MVGTPVGRGSCMVSPSVLRGGGLAATNSVDGTTRRNPARQIRIQDKNLQVDSIGIDHSSCCAASVPKNTNRIK